VEFRLVITYKMPEMKCLKIECSWGF